MLHDSPETSFMMQKVYEIPMGSPPMGAPNAGVVGKNCIFDWSRSLWLRCLTAKNFVYFRQGRLRPPRCAGGDAVS